MTVVHQGARRGDVIYMWKADSYNHVACPAEVAAYGVALIVIITIRVVTR